MAQTETLNIITYKTPSEYAFQRRKMFHLCTKLTSESTSDWFKRIEGIVIGCDYGEFNNFMLIDKFISGLDDQIFGKFTLEHTLTVQQTLTTAMAYDFLANNLLDTKTEPTYLVDDFLQVEIIKNENITENHYNDGVHNLNGDNEYVDEFRLNEGNQIEEKTQEVETPKKDFNHKKSIHKEVKKKSANQTIKSNKYIDRGSKTKETIPRDNGNVILGFKIDENKRIVCLDCGKSYSDKSSYTQHKRIHTGKNLHGCIVCGKIFTMRHKMLRHMSCHENDGRSFECYLCSFKLNHLHALRTHMRMKHVVTKNDALQCSFCEKTFFSQHTFRIHLKVHQGISQSHKCPHCPREFDRRNHMLRHSAVHSDVREFMCETCGKSFKTTKQLTQHMRKHTGECPYRCSVCGKALKSCHTYKNHMRLHTGERPHQCHLCEKTFVQRPNLLKHLMVHRQEKPWKCTMCDKRFASSYHMRLHLSVHTGARPYKCCFCEKGFTQPGTLRAHKEKIHADLFNKLEPVPMC